MQALRASAARVLPGLRQMGSASNAATQEALWAKYYPQPTPTAEATSKNLKKEMLGFALLGTWRERRSVVCTVCPSHPFGGLRPSTWIAFMLLLLFKPLELSPAGSGGDVEWKSRLFRVCTKETCRSVHCPCQFAEACLYPTAGPVGAAFMFYDFVVGLEEESHHVIPPYPWMRIRRVPGMPWGDDGLFESHPRVAKVRL